MKYLLQNKFSVVINGIFQNTKSIDEALKIANKLNVDARVFELSVDLQTLLKRDLAREGVPKGRRKPLGKETVTKIYNTLKENPYPNAVQIDTKKTTQLIHVLR